MSEMHQALLARGISVAQRSVTYLMQRDARTGDLTHHGSGADQGTLTAARTRDPGPRWGASRMWATKCSGWYVTATRREILLARPLLSRTQGDLTALLKEVKQLLKELEVPVTGVISDREETRGSAVRLCLSRGAASTLSVSLLERRHQAALRGQPACQNAVEEAAARRATD